MNVLITLTTAGVDTGPFNLYSNTDSYVTAFQTNIAKSLLVAGYTSTVVPAGTTTVRVKSTGLCTTYVDLFITGSGGTTTTTTTPYVGPTTTTTTTPYVGPATTTTTTTGGPTTTTTTTPYVGPATTTTTTTGIAQQWYQLTNCSTLAVDYSWNYNIGSYSINERVTDISMNVYRITQTYSSNPGGSNLFIATTGQTGCPSGTTTTTTQAPQVATNILVEATTAAGADQDCLGTLYPVTVTTVRATLYDQYGTVMNVVGSAITVTVNSTYDPCYGGSIPTNYNIIIGVGQYTATVNWDSIRTVDCGQSNCIQETDTYNCAFSNTASLPFRAGTVTC